MEKKFNCFLDPGYAKGALREHLEAIKTRMRNPRLDFDRAELILENWDLIATDPVCVAQAEQIARFGRGSGLRLVLRTELARTGPLGTVPLHISGSAVLSQLIEQDKDSNDPVIWMEYRGDHSGSIVPQR